MDNTTEIPIEDDYVLLSLDNPVFRSYLFATTLLVLKIMLMPLYVGRYRFGRGIVISPEDVPIGKVVLGKAQVKHDDPDLERVRRAHLNDIENIPVFIAVGLVYVFTMPAPLTAAILYYLFIAFRVLHTIVYTIIIIPQPARFLCYGGGYIITLYMIIMCLVKISPV